MEEAKKNMHAFSTTTYTGFQCTVSEETSEKFKDYRLELRMVGQPMIEAATAVAKIPKSTVESAVDALLKYKAAHPGTEKLQLLPQDEYVYLNLTLKKIPPSPRTNPHKVPLTYPILDSSSELCLIIDDRPKTPTPPSDEIKKLIKSQSIPISKVLKLSKLKSNYKPFEAKRKLCDSYDMFLVDKRVVHLLPRLIGKEFFKKKRLPLGVDLSKKNLKSQVDRALGSALLYLRTGTCCMMKVGKVSMDRDEIVENVIDAFNGAVEKVPKKWDGVRSLHLKFCDSVALPIYQVLPDVKLKIEGLKEKVLGDEIEKISDTEVKEIGGGDNGKSESKKRKKKGRIHEVRYMDDGMDVEAAAADGLDEIEKISDTEVREIGGGDNGKSESKKRKKKERIHKDRNMDDGKDVEAAADGLDEIEHAKIVLSDGAKGKKKNKLKEKPNEGKDKAKDAKRKKRTAE